MKYFAYGTNCNAHVLERKGVRAHSPQRAALPGHRLLFNKLAMRERLPEGIGFANVEPASDHRVEGIVYELPDEDVATLDAAERCPGHYERIDVDVEVDGDLVRAFTYRARPEFTAPHLRPSRNYLNHIATARDFLSHQYHEALEAHQVFEGTCAACGRSKEVIFISADERLWMLCQPCREARHRWGSVRGRVLSVPEAAAVMELVRERGGFSSVQAVVDEAVAQRIINP